MYTAYQCFVVPDMAKLRCPSVTLVCVAEGELVEREWSVVSGEFLPPAVFPFTVPFYFSFSGSKLTPDQVKFTSLLRVSAFFGEKPVFILGVFYTPVASFAPFPLLPQEEMVFSLTRR